VSALLGQAQVVCPSCASETPLSEETRQTLRAIASDRANTDQAARKLQEARQRLSRTSIIWPLLEHPVITGWTPA